MNRDLIERAIGGDRDAYTELFRSSIDRSYALATVVLSDPERARDVVREAYVSAWRDIASVRDPDRFEGWLRRLVVRACYEELRREAATRGVEVQDHALTHERPVADEVEAVARDDQLERGLGRLDANQRTALIVRYYLGLSVPDMASAMAIPLGTAKSRLSRVTTAMREGLDADDRLEPRKVPVRDRLLAFGPTSS